MIPEDIEFVTTRHIDAAELMAFYDRQHHETTRELEKLQRQLDATTCFVTARRQGELVGFARGISDGVNGRLVECKLDPEYQGPACITRTDGRIEHDTTGIAKQMALRVIEALHEEGAERIDTLAHSTEVDFCEELGFKRMRGVVALELIGAASSLPVGVGQTTASDVRA